MKKNVVLGLLLGSCLVSACVSQYPLNNNGIDEVKMIKDLARVEVKENKDIFPKKAFSTKAVDFSSTEIKKLTFSIFPLNTTSCDTPNSIKDLTTTVDWTAGTPINIGLTNVPLGKALLSLHALDVDGKIISSLHGMLDVVAGSNNAKLSIFDSVVAQVFMQWLSCTNEAKALWQKVSIADVRNFIKVETGYDETTNKFTTINPTSLDIIKIASNILQNNGVLPATGTITNIEGSSSVNVNISEIGASVSVNDLTSTPVTATTTNTVAIPNVSFGKWLLTVRKTGFQTYQTEFTANGTVNLPNIQLMPLVVPTPTPIETPFPTPTPTSIPVPTPTPSAVLTEVTITTVPDEKMLIDGYEDDWTGINPVMTDATNNGYPDLTALYLAMDSQHLYWKIDAVNDVSTSSGSPSDAGFLLMFRNNSNTTSDGDIFMSSFDLTQNYVPSDNTASVVTSTAIKLDKGINGIPTGIFNQRYDYYDYYTNVFKGSDFIKAVDKAQAFYRFIKSPSTAKKAICEGRIPLIDLGNINNKELYWGFSTGSNQPKDVRIVNFAPPTASTSPYKVVLSSFRDGNRELYTMDGNGNNQTRLTNTPTEQEHYPIFSPDGSKIAYNTAGSTNKLYVINVDGTNKKDLGNFGNAGILGQFNAQSWSPDGNKVVYHFGQEIYAYDLTTDIKTKLSTTATDSFPVFSSDGTKIAFLSSRNSETALYVMNIDGTNQRKLVNYQDTFASYPQWETGSSRLLYTSNGNIYKITESDVNPSANNFPITSKVNVNDVNTAPFWLGSRIMFNGMKILSDNSSNTKMYSGTDQGNTPAVFYDGNFLDKNVSSDGKRIVFTINSNNPEVYTLNADGFSRRFKLSNNTMDGEADIH